MNMTVEGCTLQINRTNWIVCYLCVVGLGNNI